MKLLSPMEELHENLTLNIQYMRILLLCKYLVPYFPEPSSELYTECSNKKGEDWALRLVIVSDLQAQDHHHCCRENQAAEESETHHNMSVHFPFLNNKKVETYYYKYPRKSEEYIKHANLGSEWAQIRIIVGCLISLTTLWIV